ncbi:unconventional myosin-XVIIIa isoform X3 [Ctenocephalides felis]|uniref:unconventional myosin-XVIIIa isoform X3 n=1 Tax=Ctenocephalides felis TaxID=7515 RepID=UPI000E6E3B61|nr:unconventional myosin-XVIIIa isoform X3 [Ctenocephalides felis]
MFNFMKKGGSSSSALTEDREKERRKADKKLRKEQQKRDRASGTMSAEELLRLDEVRRSLKLRGRRKEKLPSGITADYSASFFAQLERDSPSVDGSTPNNNASLTTNGTDLSSINGGGSSLTHSSLGSNAGSASLLTHSDSSEASLNSITNQNSIRQSLPPIPPRPPKRGILKGPRTSLTNLSADATDHSSTILEQNTIQNELISYQNLEPISSKLEVYDTLPVGHHHANSASPDKQMNNLQVLTSTSPSAESLTSTNSSFATPPFSLSPVGESQGYHRWSRVATFEDVDLPLPDLPSIILPAPRTLTIYRQKGPKNDFGFSLRRAMILDKSDSKDAEGKKNFKAVIFAEPGTVGGATGLLPGDRLLEVNGVKVETRTREEVIEMIKSSEESVTVTVQPIAELAELSARCLLDISSKVNGETENSYSSSTLRRSASKRYDTNAKTDEQLADEQAWSAPSADAVWLVHRNGFTSAIRLHQDGSRVKVRILANGQELTVDEDDIEKANAPSLDLAEDLASLHFLNEASALHILRQRHHASLAHTYAGNTLIIVNPMTQLCLYSDKVVSLFRGCKPEDMPPHVYALAQSAYRSMLVQRRDHSLVFLGRSGSGKTTSFKHALYYLALAAGSTNRLLTPEKLNAVYNLLESFGNARTSLNQNATRFAQIFSLDFDQSGVIASASIQVLLLERARVARRVHGEATFHVLYRLISGAEGALRRELLLQETHGSVNGSPGETGGTNPFFTPFSRLEDKQKASTEFQRLQQAMEQLGISDKEQKAIWRTVAAIYHLGCAGAAKGGSGNRYQFASASAAQRAATLLGTTVEELNRVTFGQQSGNTPATPRAAYRTPSPTGPSDRNEVVGLEALEGLLIGLYTEVFNCITGLINRSISTSAHTVHSLLLLDCPGFQNPASAGQQGGATLNDLIHNYLQERLQLLFHNHELMQPRDRYAQEQIELDGYCDSGLNPEPMVNMLDKTAQNSLIRTSQTDIRESDRRGLLWLLDEESLYPGSSDETFLERLFLHYGDRESQILLRKAPGSLQFILHHLQGTNPVLYSSSGWLRGSRENPVSKMAISILQESTKEEISSLFVSMRGLGPASFLGGSIVGIDGSQSLRRASSIRRTFTSGAAGMKRRSVCLQAKFAVDGLIDTLRRTRILFAHCFLPQHQENITANGNPVDINVPLLRSQLRGAQILDAVRLHKQGFPEHLPLPEFRRRFGLIALANNTGGGDKNTELKIQDDVQIAQEVLSAADVDAACYRIGPSQVLLRAGTLGALESKRDALLTARITALQARCRGVLARRRANKTRVQTLAARCIQRNVRAFMAVRDWPWWRLLVRVTPLLGVHRTEELLKARVEELEILKSKFEKLEAERTVLKHENDRLESKLSEMTADLADEHSTATLATERLEREEQERVRLERELQQAQDKNRGLQQTSERLEMELLYARSDLNGSAGNHSDSEDGNGEPEAYRRRYERAQRELEFTRRRLQQQHEDDLEQLVGLKKQLEKKLSDAYEEVEEQRQVAGQWKRKAQKLTAEQNDLRLLLEQRGARNALLEKRQRRHETELQHAAEELRSERSQRERAQRERDVAMAERDGAEQSLQDLRLELDLKEERLQNLRLELDSGSGGGSGVGGGRVDEELATLRKIRSELEHKTRDQEEELDDLAGQVQLLEQHKLRLEMMLENVRKEGRHEAQQRDEELEETRANAQKKVKALESQLESEHAERTLLLRERHELERRLAAAEEEARGDGRARAEQAQRAKRELKRTKALLRDAQAQLERQRQEAPARSQLRALRNQLEDAEAARAAACKARAQLDAEAREAQQALEEATRARTEAEQRLAQATRERAELRGQLDENEEELAEVMKKYRAAVQQLGTEQRALAEHASKLQDAERKAVMLQETVSELTARLEAAETLGDTHDALALKRMELRVKELESKLEMEQTARGRLEVQVNRHREALERATTEASQAQAREQLAQDTCRKLQRAHRELREEHQTLITREAECAQRRKDAEKRLEACEAEAASARSDLRLALQRIEDLQAAMMEEEEMEDCDGGSAEDGSDDSDQDSSGEESIETFLAKNKIGRSSETSEKPTVRVSPRQSQSAHDTSSPRRSISNTRLAVNVLKYILIFKLML